MRNKTVPNKRGPHTGRRALALLLSCLMVMAMLPVSVGAAEETGGAPCGHVHDESCGYVEGEPGSCTHTCELCAPQPDDGTEPVETALEQVAALFAALPEAESLTAETGERAAITAQLAAARGALAALSEDERQTFAATYADLLAAAEALEAALAKMEAEETTAPVQTETPARLRGTPRAGTTIPVDGTTTTLANAISNAQSGDTLQITAGITLTSGVSFSDKNLTLDLNGQTITYSSTNNTKAITLTGTASLTVTDSGSNGKLEVTGNTGKAIYNSGSGTITVNGGAVSANASNSEAIWNNSASGTIIVNGGTVSSTGEYSAAIYNASTGTVNVSDGTVTTSGGSYAIGNYVNGTVDVTGGTVSADTGKAIYNFGDGAVNVSGGTVEATGSNGRAIHNADGGTITVSGTAAVKATTGQAIYNAAAGTITASGGAVLATTGNAIRNVSTGEVKVEGGTVSSPNQAIWNNAAGTVTVSGGKVWASGSSGKAIYNYDAGGTVNVSGGTVEATDPNGIAIYNVNTGKITVSGTAEVTSANTSNASGTIYMYAVPSEAPKTVLEITGGTVENTASSNGYAVYFYPSSVSYANLSDYYSHTGGTVGRVHPEQPAVVLIRNGSTEAGYATLANAISAAEQTGDTLKLNQNIDLGTTGVEISGKTLTLDLNGHTITYSGSGSAIQVLNIANTALTVKDSTGNGKLEAPSESGKAIHNLGVGTVKIEGGTVTAKDIAIRNDFTGSVEVSGGTVSSTQSSGSAIQNASAGEIKVTGGTVSATGTGCNAIQNPSTGTVTVTSGTVSVTNGGIAIANTSTGAVNISGGTVSATTGRAIYNSSTGKITISGNATVTSANTYTTQGTIYLYAVPDPAAVVLEIKDSATVENTATNGYAVYFADASGVTYDSLSNYYTHTSGTVGKVYPEAPTNVVEITKDSNITKYTTLAGAITGATTGDTLQVIADIDLGTTGVEISGKALTLDLNGHTITYSGTYDATDPGCAIILKSNAGLTIKDSGTNGTLKATGQNGTAIRNASNSTVTVESGTVTATGDTGYVIDNTSGAITIKGGKLEATGQYGVAINNACAGKITISGSAEVTSANTKSTFGTIYLQFVWSGGNDLVVLDIQGGTVQNTATDGYAVYFNTTSSVTSANLSTYYSHTGGTVGKVYPEAPTNVVERYDSGNQKKGSYATLAGAIDAAATGDKLVINQNIDLGNGTGVEISGKALTLDLNGQTITHSGAAAITLKNSEGTALTVMDSTGGTGELKATGEYGTAIYNLSAGEVKVTAGTVSAVGGYAILNTSTGKVTAEGGTLKATTGVAIYNSETGKVTISGGAEITSAKTSATSGTIHLAKVPTAAPETVLKITGGTVRNTANPEGYAVYFADASGVTAANLGTYYTKTGGTVGRVYPAAVELLDSDDTFKGSYATLSEAITAAQTGDKLKVIADIDLGETGVSIDGKTLTLDLNGQIITYSSNDSAIALSGSTNTGLTVTDSSSGKTGKLESTSGTGGWVIANNSAGAVTIAGGTVSAANYCSTAIGNRSTGTVSVTGGTVSVAKEDGTAIYNSETGKVTISNNAVVTSANTSATSGTIYLNAVPSTAAVVLDIQGGTVQNTANPAGYSVYFADTSGVTAANLDTYYSKTGGTVGKVYPEALAAVERYDSGDQKKGSYDSLAGAIDAAATGDKLVINKTINLDTTGVSFSGKNLTLDLNGQTVTYSGSGSAILLSGGTNTGLTVMDSSGGQTGKLEATNGSYSGVIANTSAGTVTVASGTVSGSDQCNMAIRNGSTGTVSVTGGTVSVAATNGSTIYNNSTGTINVSGGTVTATGSYGEAIWNNSTGKITISDSAEVTSANTRTISGTIYLYAVPSSGDSQVVLDIKGGAVSNTATDGYAVYFNTNNTGVTTANLNTYYSNTGGTVGRVYPAAVELLGSDDAFKGSYATLSEAITAAQTGDKLKVIADIDLGDTGVEISGKALTLDLNGHTVTHSGSTAGSSTAITLKNSANTGLTVTDSSTGGKLEAVKVAIRNDSAGTVTVESGTVSSTGATGNAISGGSNSGEIKVTGGTVKTSGANSAAIASSSAITVEGGTVTATGSNGQAIDSSDKGTVSVSGGTVSAPNGGTAIYNNYSTGAVTISGNATVTSANTSNNSGTIYLGPVPPGNTQTLLEITGGTVKNTAAGGNAVYNNSIGAIAVSGGTLETNSTLGKTIHNASTGAVTISGGTVKATGQAIYNSSTGTVTVSGGTVEATGTSGIAIWNTSTGKVTISGTAEVTSANSSANEGTIRFNATSDPTAVVLEITGGTVKNTAAGGNAVYNNSTGTVTISGGAVEATGQDGVAIWNNSTGQIMVSGTATVTSGNTASNSGTIYLQKVPTDEALVVLDIQDSAQVTNTANGYAAYFAASSVDGYNVSSYYKAAAGATLGKVYPTPAAMPTVEVDSSGTYTVYANGAALIIAGTSATSTTIYVDMDGNGVLDTRVDKSLKELRIANAPADGSNLQECKVYGGSKENALTGDPKITIIGGEVLTIFGGGYGTGGTVTGNPEITVTGGSVGSVYGGGSDGGTVTGSPKITITGGKASSVYGGGDKADLTGNPEITMTGGEANLVYGGGRADSGSGGDVTGNTSITVENNAVVKNTVYGGGQGSTVSGKATVNFNIPNGNNKITIYGGGIGQTAKVGKTEVTLGTNGKVKSVSGGGSGSSNVTGTAQITVQGTAMNVFGVSDSSGSTVTGQITVKVDGAAKVGDRGFMNAGLRINGGSPAQTMGVASFVIGNLQDDAKIDVVLPAGYTTGVIATDADEADLEKLKLAGSGAKDKLLRFDAAKGEIYVVDAPAAEYTTDDGASWAECASLSEALAAMTSASNAETHRVRLMQDANTALNIESGTFTLDLNGHQLAPDEGTATVTVGNRAALTLTDGVGGGKLVGPKKSAAGSNVAGVAVYVEGSLTVTGSKPFTIQGGGSNVVTGESAIVLGDGSKLQVSGTSAIRVQGGDGLGINFGASAIHTETATIRCDNPNAVYQGGNATGDSGQHGGSGLLANTGIDAIIRGGTFIGGNGGNNTETGGNGGDAVFVSVSNTSVARSLVVDGGTFIGGEGGSNAQGRKKRGNGLYIESADVTINGGIFEGLYGCWLLNGTTPMANRWTVTGGQFTGKQSGLFVEATTGYGEVLSVSGGTFIGGQYALISTLADCLKGGTFVANEQFAYAIKGYPNILVGQMLTAGMAYFDKSGTQITTGLNADQLGEGTTIQVARAASKPDPVYNITGTVFESDGQPAKNASVSLKLGAKVVSRTATNEQGQYTFPSVKPGLYNVVAQKDKLTMTILVQLTNSDADNQTITLPDGAKNSEVEVAQDTCPVIVGGVEKIAADQTKPGAGESVTIKLTVEAKAEPEHKEEIIAVAGDQTLEYLDVTLTRIKTSAAGVSNEENLGDSNNQVLELVLPYDFTNKQDVTVYRKHGNDPAVALKQKQSEEDGTFWADTQNGYIHIYASKFSTYAVGYTTAATTTPSGSGGTSSYTITATAGAGGSISPSGKVDVTRNGSKTFTIRPDAGYVVADVLVDGKSVGAVESYTFEKITKAHTITARFQKETGKAAWNPFADVRVGDWFYESVQYVYEHDLMLGTSATAFSPAASTERGMIATILWRMEGQPKAGDAQSFADVQSGAYYAEAVAWANEKGIALGYGNGKFGPKDTITREQLAAILYRYAQYKGANVGAGGALDRFTDGAEVSGYAREAMAWAVEQGIITGKGGDVLAPKGQANRAETAAMLMRYLQG